MGIKKHKEFIVYRIYHIDTGKSYIGITGNYKQRMYSHFGLYNKGKSYLCNAIKKHGKDQFSHEIIFECDSWEELCKEEIEYIKIFNTKKPNGYNLTDGGDGAVGFKIPLETRKKMSKAAIGKIVSDGTRKKQSINNSGINNPFYGKEHTKKSKLKISYANKGKLSGKNNPFYGKTHPPEIIKKISDANKGSKRSCILSKDQILKIRKMLSEGIFQKIIANEFEVAQTTIGNIKRNKTYADIQLPKEV